MFMAQYNDLLAEAADLYEKKLYERAFVMYRSLAENGCVDAQVFVGWMCQKGEGVSVNAEEAVAWYERAALSGSAAAYFQLAKFSARKKIILRQGSYIKRRPTWVMGLRYSEWGGCMKQGEVLIRI